MAGLLVIDGVRVDHVESGGVGDAPELGTDLEVRAFVSLGDLDPADVDVQVVYGRVDEADRITRSSMLQLGHAQDYEAGRHRYEGHVRLESTGPFGYTVRILPRHARLAHPSELGLMAEPPETEAPVSGDLR